jgi:endoglucanase
VRARVGIPAIAALIGLVAGPPPSQAGQGGDPFADARLYVAPHSDARRQAKAWRKTRPDAARAMRAMARQPQADWFGDWTEHLRRTVRDRVARITRAGALPVLVAYNIPRRDCAAGAGASSPRAYRRWIRRLGSGVGRRAAAVVLEPDALASLDCLEPRARRVRLHLLGRAVRVLESGSGASVYLDAGHSGWQPAETMASRLRRVGVGRARGFALNVANYRRTETETAYGRTIARSLGGKHFVIDVSRNGLGPAPDGATCNPPGRALGGPPTRATHRRLVDAHLWIKRPGESDGPCNGGPPAGTWWPEYALGLAQRSTLVR